MSDAAHWTEPFSIRTSDVTPHGSVSAAAFCEYLQEAAGHHADALGVSLQKLRADGQAWVLARLRVAIDRWPRPGDQGTIETWPSGLDGIYATREFVVRVDDAVVGRATSAWFVMDTERRRPVRPPRSVRALEIPDRDPALSDEVGDVTSPERTDFEQSFSVRYHDLDLNRHVTNIRYLEWALETLPIEVFETHRLAGLALDFQTEATLGDTVRGMAQAEADTDGRRFYHALRRVDTDRTLALAMTRWESRV